MWGENIVCGWDQSDFLFVHPSFLLAFLQMKVGKAPGEGWGFAVALLLAFVFSDPCYLRARPLCI